jgi:F-type H+-transporting ATPase subunit a
MEHAAWTMVLINRLLGKPALAVLNALHITPSNPEYPIPNHVAMELIVFAIAAVFFLWLKARMSVDRPGATQQCMETLLTNSWDLGVRDLLKDSVGHGFEDFVPMIGSIGIFILFANLVSVIPTIESPTAQVSVPFGCAVLVFAYYNWCGLRKHGGFGYGRHFLGPNLALAPLMLPIEIISHSARMLSLTVRLWVNMFVSELLYGIFLGLLLEFFLFLGKLSSVGYVTAPLPLLIPVIFIALHLFVGFLQAFVFTILPVIYVSGAVATEH